MTVKEAIEYIISKSKDDESLLTDTKRFWVYLSDLAPEHRKELNVIKRGLDSDFLNFCFKDKEDIKRRVLKMRFRLEGQGVGENWIDFIIDSFFAPLGWKPPKDEEETSQAQPQQTQKQQTQNQQTQNQQTHKQQTHKQQTQNQQTHKQQTQKQQIQNQQTQKQQTQKQQIQKQQIQNQQTQKQQTHKQQTQKQQTQKQQTQKQQTQKQQTQKQQTQKQQNWGAIAFLIFIGLFISAIILSNSNNSEIKIENPFVTAKVGDYIKFGNYPQSENGDIQPIEWQVLEKENNKILVISRYGLHARRFDSDSNNWKNSEIRGWLNGDFYNNAFSVQEKTFIKSSLFSDVATDDYVFLLSKEEAEKYFANDDLRKCKATGYAYEKTGAYLSRNGYGSWWLRSPSSFSCRRVSLVIYDGSIRSRYLSKYSILVRPSLWINLGRVGKLFLIKNRP